MLIDSTRRPLRLVFEECPSVLVVRTVAIRNLNSGMLHRTDFTRFGRGGPSCTTHRLQHQVMVPKGDKMYMETLLPVPVEQPRRLSYWNPPVVQRGEEESVVPESMAWDVPYDVTTGYQDEVTQKMDLWRLNFIFNRSKAKTQDTIALLTVLDETHGHTLLTIQVKLKDYEYREGLFSIATPLRRYLKQCEAQSTGNLWQALMDDD